MTFRRAAGVEAVPIPPKVQQAPPAHDSPTGWFEWHPFVDGTPMPRIEHRVGDNSPAEAFGRHFLRCFFCRIGDRYTEDHFCEQGRDLLVAVLDEYAERAFA